MEQPPQRRSRAAGTRPPGDAGLFSLGKQQRGRVKNARFPREEAPCAERHHQGNAMKKTTSPREKTHFSLGDAFFLL
jgi:hypothetical protein